MVYVTGGSQEGLLRPKSAKSLIAIMPAFLQSTDELCFMIFYDLKNNSKFE
jgi:hypothetical protein